MVEKESKNKNKINQTNKQRKELVTSKIEKNRLNTALNAILMLETFLLSARRNKKTQSFLYHHPHR